MFGYTNWMEISCVAVVVSDTTLKEIKHLEIINIRRNTIKMSAIFAENWNHKKKPAAAEIIAVKKDLSVDYVINF